jgi:hypothetical protein
VTSRVDFQKDSADPVVAKRPEVERGMLDALGPIAREMRDHRNAEFKVIHQQVNKYSNHSLEILESPILQLNPDQ